MHRKFVQEELGGGLEIVLEEDLVCGLEQTFDVWRKVEHESNNRKGLRSHGGCQQERLIVREFFELSKKMRGFYLDASEGHEREFDGCDLAEELNQGREKEPLERVEFDATACEEGSKAFVCDLKHVFRDVVEEIEGSIIETWFDERKQQEGVGCDGLRCDSWMRKSRPCSEDEKKKSEERMKSLINVWFDLVADDVFCPLEDLVSEIGMISEGDIEIDKHLMNRDFHSVFFQKDPFKTVPNGVERLVNERR